MKRTLRLAVEFIGVMPVKGAIETGRAGFVKEKFYGR